MEVALQFGWGMMRLDRELIDKWGGGMVILSPRDLTPAQLIAHAEEMAGLAGAVLLDPQFYLPHADHERLCSHSYWPRTYDTADFWSGAGVRNLINDLARLNAELSTSAFILPGLLAAEVSDDWLEVQTNLINISKESSIAAPVFATIALSAEAARDDAQVHDVLDMAGAWNSPGYYVVFEHPRGEYLVDDPTWLANCLDLVAGLRLRGAKVVIGYAAHQFLCARITGATTIAAGTWLNVRTFPPEKFSIPEEDLDRRKSTWYYCPRSLSEYQLTFLDVALEQGLLHGMAPPPEHESTWTEKLFQGVRPTTAGFTQADGFAHFLNSIRCQATAPTGPTYLAALDEQRRELDAAEALLHRLRGAGVSGKQRDFSRVVDTNRAAMALFDARRGQIMQRQWNALHR